MLENGEIESSCVAEGGSHSEFRFFGDFEGQMASPCQPKWQTPGGWRNLKGNPFKGPRPGRSSRWRAPGGWFRLNLKGNPFRAVFLASKPICPALGCLFPIGWGASGTVSAWLRALAEPNWYCETEALQVELKLRQFKNGQPRFRALRNALTRISLSPALSKMN